MPQGDPFPNGFPAGYRSRAGGFKVYTLKSKYAADRTLIDSIQRRIKDSNTRAAREFIEDVRTKLNRPLSSFGPRRVQNSPSMGNPGNGESNYHEGQYAPTNRKGKGRSTSFSRINEPSREWQPMDAPNRRLGSLTGNSSGTARSAGTLLSNFGENKDMGNGMAGASASRIRGARNVIMNPSSFMSRFTIFYVAKQVTDSIASWRGWDNVSWSMSNKDAAAVLKDHQSGGGTKHQLEDVFVGAGGVVGGAAEVFKPFAMLGMMSQAAMAVAWLKGDNFEAQAAQGASLFADSAKWFGRGGPFGFAGNPFSAASTWNRDAGQIVSGAQDTLENKAIAKFSKFTKDNLTRHQDANQMLAVGGVDAVHGALKSSPNYKQAVKEIGVAARASLDVTKFQADWINRFMEDKRKVGYR